MKTARLERYFSTSEIHLILITARIGFELLDLDAAGIVDLTIDKNWTSEPERFIEDVAEKLGELTEMLELEK